MEKFYLGTKLVQAWPALRVTTRGGSYEFAEVGDVVDPSAVKVEEGYRVQYDDGYRSWSPRDVFERSYRVTTGLNFGLAIEAAKRGEKIARSGWNGKGMFLFLADVEGFHTAADLECISHLNGDLIQPCMVMKTADDKFCVGWLASQTDMLAEDWMIV